MKQDNNQSYSFIGRARTAYSQATLHGIASGMRRVCTPKRLGVAIAISIVLTVTVMTAYFYWPRNINLSFSGTNCVAAPTLLPSLATTRQSDAYAIRPVTSLRVGSIELYARSACITVKQPPKEHTSEQVSIAVPGAALLKKTVTVRTDAFPALTKPLATSKPLSTKDILKVQLDTPDSLFTYTLTANGQKAPCPVHNKTLHCNIPALKLAQATPYDVAIVRSLGKQNAGRLLQEQITTVEPIRVDNTSIASGQLVYDAPASLTLHLNKSAANPKGIRLENRGASPVQILPIDTKIAGSTITITLKEPLPRSTALAVVVPSLEALDGAYLPAPFELPFATSGGPKVKGISIGSAKVQPDSTITLTFDSNVAPDQNLAEFIKIEATSGAVGVITAQGNRVTIKTSGQGRCMPFTVRILDGLKNEFGISGNSAWQFRARTLCQTTFSIGNSVQGRTIMGYRFGNGAQKIIFVGGIHGDERSSVQILNRWIEQLELNPSRIPAHQTIIVIPNANPDGYAANRRTNANNVDLNRNFPSNNWKSGVTMPDKSYWPTGGGTAPLSEPESRALANYVTAQQPRLVLTYHAAGSIVQPNGAGDSTPIGIEYGKKSIVGYLPPGQSSFFDYDTTGAFEDWLHDKHGKPALVIELTSRTSNDYNGHENALWYVAGI